MVSQLFFTQLFSSVHQNIPTTDNFFSHELVNNQPNQNFGAFGYGLHEALLVSNEIIELDIINVADGIMEGYLYSFNLIKEITQNARYDPETGEVDWDLLFSKSPTTYNLGLHALDMIVILGQAYLQTDRIDYLAQSKKILDDWIDYSYLETTSKFCWNEHAVAYRVHNIIYFLSIREEMGEPNIIYDVAFVERVVESLILHGTFLADDVNYLPNSNHGLMMDRALIALSLFLIQDEHSSYWYEKGFSRLEQQMAEQFTEKGVHVENSPAYAWTVIVWFLNIEAFLNQFDLSLNMDERIKKAQEAYILQIEPNLYLPQLGHTDYTKFVPTDEWYSTEKASLNYIITQGQQGEPPEDSFTVFPEAGLAITRQGWLPADQFEETTWALIKGGYIGGTAHKQNDDLSFVLYANGHEVFVDPGFYNYEAENPIHQYLESALAHNTVIVDNYSFLSTELGDSKVKFAGWQSTEDYDYIVSVNHLYHGVSIRRHFIYIKPDLFIIFDDIIAEGEHDYSQLFHLSEFMQIEEVNQENARLVSNQSALQVELMQWLGTDDVDLKSGIVDGLPQSVISREFNQTIDSATIQFSKNGTNVQFLTSITLLNHDEIETKIEDAHVDKGENQIILEFDNGSELTIPMIEFEDEIEVGSNGIVEIFEDIHAEISTQKTEDNFWSFDINPLTQPENFQYAWLIYKDGELIEKTPFDNTSSRTYFFTEPGLYIFRIWIKNMTTLEVFHSNIEQINISEISLSESRLALNTAEFQIALASEETYQYAWYIYRNGVLIERIWYSDPSQLTYTFIKNGYYKIKVFVSIKPDEEKLFSSFFDPIRIDCYQEMIMD
jgi:hypothetical protein